MDYIRIDSMSLEVYNDIISSNTFLTSPSCSFINPPAAHTQDKRQEILRKEASS